MTQADTALNGGREIVPTGKSFEISRRSMLGAVAAFPVMAAPAIATAKESPFLESMRRSREAANEKFWKLHAEALALEEAWLSDPDQSQPNFGRHVDNVTRAYDRALLQAVFCPAAVLAKLNIVDFNAREYALPAPVFRASNIIEWDLERCAQERQFHNPNV